MWIAYHPTKRIAVLTGAVRQSDGTWKGTLQEFKQSLLNDHDPVIKANANDLIVEHYDKKKHKRYL